MKPGIFYLIASLAQLSFAQRPSSIPICDYYTTALLKDNTAANQLKLLTLIVNTALIGNYTQPNVGISVTGILNPGTFNGVAVNLLPYFDGTSGATTNMSGVPTAGVSFVEGGGVAALMESMPAFNTSSNQYTLLVHFYQIFGVLLGCSMQGPNADSVFPSYQGDASLFKTHQFMDLDHDQMGYFIEQVGMSAASFGAATCDVTIVGDALTKIFDYQCSPPYALTAEDGPHRQSICIASSCPFDPMADCSLYPMQYPMTSSSISTSVSVSVSVSASAEIMHFPTMIVPVAEGMAYGPSFFINASSKVTTFVSFNTASNLQGNCKLQMLFPPMDQLQTSSYSMSGDGQVTLCSCNSPVTSSTTFSNAPQMGECWTSSVRENQGTVTFGSMSCPSNGQATFAVKTTGNMAISMFEDFNQPPVGIVMTSCNC